MFALRKGKKMTPAFMMNMEFIRIEREMPPVRKVNMTKLAIAYIFERGEVKSSEIKKYFKTDYSPSRLIHKYVKRGLILNRKIGGRDAMYKIAKGVTQADFKIKD